MSDRIAVFSQGQVEQVGTPFELYERPASNFVADFVGSSNLASGMLLRPEKIALLPAGADAPEGFEAQPGSVREAVYLGAVTRYAVTLADGTSLAVMEANTAPLPARTRLLPGDAVLAAWPRLARVSIQRNKGESS